MYPPGRERAVCTETQEHKTPWSTRGPLVSLEAQSGRGRGLGWKKEHGQSECHGPGSRALDAMLSSLGFSKDHSVCSSRQPRREYTLCDIVLQTPRNFERLFIPRWPSTTLSRSPIHFHDTGQAWLKRSNLSHVPFPQIWRTTEPAFS